MHDFKPIELISLGPENYVEEVDLSDLNEKSTDHLLALAFVF